MSVTDINTQMYTTDDRKASKSHMKFAEFPTINIVVELNKI